MEAAIAGLAPFRLGLTATPERADGGEALLPELIGPIVYRREITDVAGEFLAPYETRAGLRRPDAGGAGALPARCREEYRRFVAERGISHVRAGRLAALPVRGEPLGRGLRRRPGVPRAEAPRAGRERASSSCSKNCSRSTPTTAC